MSDRVLPDWVYDLWLPGKGVDLTDRLIDEVERLRAARNLPARDDLVVWLVELLWKHGIASHAPTCPCGDDYEVGRLCHAKHVATGIADELTGGKSR